MEKIRSVPTLVDIILIIYYKLLHLVIVQNIVRLPMIRVEVEVKLVIIHQVLPNDHHHLQIRFHRLPSSIKYTFG